MMKKLLCFAFVFMVLISCASAFTGDVLVVDMTLSKDDSVQVNSLRVIDGKSSIEVVDDLPPNYKLVIEDIKGNKLYEVDLAVLFFIYDGPAVNEESIYKKIPYNANMKSLKLYHGTTLIFTYEINLCNNNGICNTQETYYSCPADCSLDELDGFCTHAQDGVCDPDCLQGYDPDCGAGGVTPPVPEEKYEAPEAESKLALWVILGVLVLFMVILAVLLLKGKKHD